MKLEVLHKATLAKPKRTYHIGKVCFISGVMCAKYFSLFKSLAWNSRGVNIVPKMFESREIKNKTILYIVAKISNTKIITTPLEIA